MRNSRAFLLCAAVAFATAGCEVHERGPGPVGVEVTPGESQGPVIEGGVAIDVAPDPAQRDYIYDEGYPPGTYLYDNYYYYDGYRYPRDVFVNRYVQENIRQHRFVNTDENRRQGQSIEQKQRSDFSKNHGARQGQAAKAEDRHAEQAPARQTEAPNAGHVERPENKAPAKEEHQATVEHPENRSTANEEHRGNAERPENKTPANEEHRASAPASENRAKPENEQRKPQADESKKDDSRKDEAK